jgi:hypothetical protein
MRWVEIGQARKYLLRMILYRFKMTGNCHLGELTAQWCLYGSNAELVKTSLSRQVKRDEKSILTDKEIV